LTYLLLGSIAFSSVACKKGGDGSVAGGSGRTILLVTVDGLRAERLSTFGGNLPAPLLDALVSRGSLYRNAWTSAPMTRPSLAALHTAQGPDRIGVRDDISDRLSPDIPTVASVLKAHGWTTAAFIGSPLAGFGSGLDAGFDLYDAPEELEVGPGRFLPNARPASEVVRNAETWLQTASADAKVFAWIHLADAHGSIARGSTALDRVGRYDTALGGAMTALGNLAKLVEAPEVEVLFVGTFGTLLGESGAFGSSYWLRDETLASVIVWKGPRSSSGVRDDRDRSVLDVAPTILVSAGLQPLPAAEGLDLAVVPPAERVLRAWTWAPDDEVAFPTLTAERRDGRWSVEPWEEARSWPRPATPRPRILSEVTLSALASHGVSLDLSSDAGSPPPEDANAFYLDLVTTRAAFLDGNEARALQGASEMLARYPGNLGALTINLFLASMTPQSPQRDMLIRDALRRFPTRGEVLHWIGHEAFAAGNPSRGETLVRAAAELGPADADHWYDLACARALQGDRDGALDYLRRAIDSGYRNWAWIEQDPDLAGVRADRRFAELLAAHGR
jgi:hypothetical protein